MSRRSWRRPGRFRPAAPQGKDALPAAEPPAELRPDPRARSSVVRPAARLPAKQDPLARIRLDGGWGRATRVRRYFLGKPGIGGSQAASGGKFGGGRPQMLLCFGGPSGEKNCTIILCSMFMLGIIP